MCLIDDCEPNEFFSSRESTARKEHKCGECGRTIHKGEKYHYAAGKSDGDMWSAKQCLHCHKAAQLLVDNCGGFLYGGISEDLQEHISEILPWSMAAARSVVGINRQWQRFDCKGLMTL